MGPGGRPEARRATQSTQKSCLFGVPPWWHQKIWMMSPKNWYWANKLHFWPKNLLFLRYTHITPPFWARTDPTQWDHISPISWGNLFDPWQGQKWKIIFWGTFIKKHFGFCQLTTYDNKLVKRNLKRWSHCLVKDGLDFQWKWIFNDHVVWIQRNRCRGPDCEKVPEKSRVIAVNCQEAKN